MPQYFIIYKPYQVLSAFSNVTTSLSAKGERLTLKDFFDVPHDVYPVGRLDNDSEGLLILTNDTQLNHKLLHPSFAHEREYWVEIEGVINNAALDDLQAGIVITIDGKPCALKKCIAKKFEASPPVPPRDPPIRFRKNIPVSWIKLILTEGKNRQVRRMTAKVGYPTLRLIRYRIGQVNIDGLNPGDMRELPQKEIYDLLFKK